ncbi:MAG: family 10 glycosylhydrolase, partial [Candidatus Gastranaerophilaceae bacterium]
KWAVEEAKKRNIQIHAWIWVLASGNDRHNSLVSLPDDYPGPILSKHPEWMLIGEKGNTRPDNQHEFWLDPSDQNARNYIISMAEEIVKNYDVDGIHLDYIRYPFQSDNNLMGFNKSSLDQFEKDTGYRIMEINQNTINAWNAWKENKINTFVKDISTSLRKIKPDITISAAVFGKNNNYRKSTIQQNWELWVNNGWVDMLNPMIYALNKDSLQNNLAYFNESINKNVLIYPGIAFKNLDVPEIAEQMNTITNQGLLGYSIFAVAFLNDEKLDFLKGNNTLLPSKNNLYEASLFLNEYNLYIISFLENSSEIDENHYNNLASLINESNSLITQLNSPSPDIKNIKLNITNFKIISQNMLNKEFKYYQSRLKILNSYVSRAEILVNLELKKLKTN